MKASRPPAARRFTLFRDSRAEGWRSMNRYADHLIPALRPLMPREWELHVPEPPAGVQLTYAHIADRTLRYPFWARRHAGATNHVLDHSYGHLLFALDPGRTVVTVHDLAPLHYPGRRAGLSRLGWEIAWYGLQRGQQAIVLSEFVGREVQSHLHLPADRIAVVPLGVSPAFAPPQPEQRAEVRRRHVPAGHLLLLHVGHGQRRKDLPALLRTAALLRRQKIPAVLLQVGARCGRAECRLIRELRLGDGVRFLGALPDDELIPLYGAADVFVFPSRYEGLGLPVLEAMACGTPVVCSAAASLPEAAADAALLVAPGKIEEFAAAIERLRADEGLRRQLIARGLRRAAEFTWERCARQTMAAYRRFFPDLFR